MALSSLTGAASAPYTTYDITLVVELPSYESSESNALKFTVYKPLPASIGTFTTNFFCDGTSIPSETDYYKVTNYSNFRGSLSPAGGVSLPDAGSGARYEWYICVNGTVPTSPVLTDNVASGFTGYSVGTYVTLSSLPEYIDSTSSGVPCFLRCKISFPTPGVAALESFADSPPLYLFKF